MQDLCKALQQRGWMLATAESCTGGLISAAITDIPGSSEIFDRGFITYSNEAKMDMLGVPQDLLAEHGAVSAPVAEAMAKGALENSRALIAVSCTGIAGPGGGTDIKPVGLVFIGLAVEGQAPRSFEYHFDGGRQSVRQQTVDKALMHVLEALS